jgi:hypothetical protein
MVRNPGDRRGRARYDVYGALWGTLCAGDSARVCLLTQYGALIESHQPLAVESIQSLSLEIDGQTAVTKARVCNVTLGPSERGHHYLVGMEFVAPPTAFLAVVDLVMMYRAYPNDVRPPADSPCGQPQASSD